MKLYGTISSERATKGQGGQKYLKMSLLHELPGYVWQALSSQENEINLVMTYSDGYPKLTIHLPKTWNITYAKNLEILCEYTPCEYTPKAKRQKGEKCVALLDYNIPCENIATHGNFCKKCADKIPL